jgi:hypothetical protein
VNRLILASAVAAAACAVSVPAVAGLANNPSFSHRLPVNVPSQARVVHFDGNGKVVSARHGSDDPSSTRVPSPGHNSHGETEPGDDHGGPTNVPTPTESGHNNGVATQPGDDRGGQPQPSGAKNSPTTPGDDKGSPTDAPTSHGGKGGHGG